MDDVAPQEIEAPEPPRDLRAELFQNVSARFAESVESNGSLPVAAQKALVALLDSEAATAAQIIAAASKDDPEQGEAGNE